MTCRILIADDSTPIQKVIKIAFSKYAVEIITAVSLAEAIRESERARPDLVIADASLPGVSAANDFTRLLGKSQGAAMIILMGTYDSVRDADLRAAGLEAILKKPFDAMELLEASERMIPGKLKTTGSGQIQNTGRNQVLKLDQNRNHTVPETSLPPPPPATFSNTPNVPSFLLDHSDHEESRGSVPVVDTTRKGLPAFDPTSFPSFGGSGGPEAAQQAVSPGLNSTGAFHQIPPAPSVPAYESASQRIQPPENIGGMMQDAAEELIRRELPGLIERAVLRYCNEHFKSIAKEVIGTELRRLADEKARYLVDQ